MIFGVFAALSLRAIGFDHLHHEICSNCCQSGEMCMADPFDTNLPGDDQQDDKDSSSGHKHNGCCATGMVLFVDNSLNCRLGVPGSSLFRVRHDGEVPPEKPYLSSEKPPLI